MPIPRVAFLPANLDACALYRMFMPHLHVDNSKFIFRHDRLHMEELATVDVVVVQRQVTEGNLRAIQMMKKAGKKVVYDLDDNMWNLPGWNPAAKIFKEMQGGFTVCARECDVVTVSTQGLKAAVKTSMPGINAEILITPNAMDFNLFQASSLGKDDGRVVMGWAGSNTHTGDVLEAWSVLPRLLREYPQLHLEFVGMAPSEKLGLHQHPRVRFRPWVPVGEFPNRFASWAWDIALAPISENRFNRSKSAIKMYEAAALKIPCLATNYGPYAEFGALGGDDLRWLLCSTQMQWRERAAELIENAEKRQRLGQLMYDTCKQYFDIERIRDNWIYAFQKVLGWVQ